MYVSGNYQLSPVVNWRHKVATTDAYHINQLITALHTLELSTMTGKPQSSSIFLLVNLTHYVSISRYTSAFSIQISAMAS